MDGASTLGCWIGTLKIGKQISSLEKKLEKVERRALKSTHIIGQLSLEAVCERGPEKLETC